MHPKGLYCFYSEVEKRDAEIERLREELSAVCFARDDWHKVADSRSAEINRLAAEVAAVGDKLLAEIVKSDQLQKHLVACNTANVRLATELNAAKDVIENIVESEVEPLKALLWEASKTLIEVARMPNHEHIADAHNETVKRIRAALGDEP